MEDLTIRKVSGKDDIRTFIFLPEKVHNNNPGWLPPIYMDEFELFNSKKNKSYLYCDTIMLLAFRGKKPVGRIMGIISHRYNQIKKEDHARFCFLEAYDDAEAVTGLLREVEEWAVDMGMDALVGPLGFSDKDPQGLLVEGFEYPSVITSATNSAYLPELVKGAGFKKKRDLVEYLAEVPKELPELFKRVLNRFESNKDINLITFRKKSDLKPYIIGILELMNETFTEIYGFVPLSDPEKRELAKRYLPILDPEFIKAVTVNGELAGFSIAMPDISDGLKRARGKLLPFGFIKVLNAAKRTDKLVMLLGGITKKHRGKGIDALMGASILDSVNKKGMKYLDSHLVLEDNVRMRSEYERIGGKVVKRFRIFVKPL